MRIIVDTNIIFSALLNSKGTISDLILNSQGSLDFYTPSATLEELDNHTNKLLSISGLSKEALHALRQQILRRIYVIDLENVSHESWESAITLTASVDEFDAPFVALTLDLGGFLWTGDKKLRKGLQNAKGLRVLDAQELKDLRNSLEED